MFLFLKTFNSLFLGVTFLGFRQILVLTIHSEQDLTKVIKASDIK